MLAEIDHTADFIAVRQEPTLALSPSLHPCACPSCRRCKSCTNQPRSKPASCTTSVTACYRNRPTSTALHVPSSRASPSSSSSARSPPSWPRRPFPSSSTSPLWCTPATPHPCLASEQFLPLLARMDESMAYLHQHPEVRTGTPVPSLQVSVPSPHPSLTLRCPPSLETRATTCSAFASFTPKPWRPSAPTSLTPSRRPHRAS